jgi:hypothetical protein
VWLLLPRLSSCLGSVLQARLGLAREVEQWSGPSPSLGTQVCVTYEVEKDGGVGSGGCLTPQ